MAPHDQELMPSIYTSDIPGLFRQGLPGLSTSNYLRLDAVTSKKTRYKIARRLKWSKDQVYQVYQVSIYLDKVVSSEIKVTQAK